jgi:hypothetical protein
MCYLYSGGIASGIMSLFLVFYHHGKAYKDICVFFLGGKDEEYCYV